MSPSNTPTCVSLKFSITWAGREGHSCDLEHFLSLQHKCTAQEELKILVPLPCTAQAVLEGWLLRQSCSSELGNSCLK